MKPSTTGQRFALGQSLHRRRLVAAAALATCLGALRVQAVPVYDESVSGDLSTLPNSPTGVSVGLGHNEVHGTTGRASTTSPVDRDFFSFIVPAGQQLTAIELLDGTTFAGPQGFSFIGVVAGPDFGPTVPTQASALLGWHHYRATEIGTDILDDIGAGAGATGFTGPLGPGTYSFWVQETAAGSSVHYGLDFQIGRIAVPDAGPGLGVSLGALGLMLLTGRTSRDRSARVAARD